MIAEVRVPSGLCNIIPDLFIKFNSLLETACTHDLGTGAVRQGSGYPPNTPPIYTSTHIHTHYENSQTHAVHPLAQWHSNTRTHLITHLPFFLLSPSYLMPTSHWMRRWFSVEVFCALLLFVFSEEQRDNKSVTWQMDFVPRSQI